MADFPAATALPGQSPTLAQGDTYSAINLAATDVANIQTPFFYQRIYDNSLGQYVYYTLDSIDATPDALDTVPNHTGLGSLVAASHEILERRLQ